MHWFALVCIGLRSSAVVCGRLHWCALVCIGLRSSAFVCGRVHWYALVCGRLRSSAVVCIRLRSSAFVCGRLHWYALVYVVSVLSRTTLPRYATNLTAGTLPYSRTSKAKVVDRFRDPPRRTAHRPGPLGDRFAQSVRARFLSCMLRLLLTFLLSLIVAFLICVLLPRLAHPFRAFGATRRLQPKSLGQLGGARPYRLQWSRRCHARYPSRS